MQRAPEQVKLERLAGRHLRSRSGSPSAATACGAERRSFSPSWRSNDSSRTWRSKAALLIVRQARRRPRRTSPGPGRCESSPESAAARQAPCCAPRPAGPARTAQGRSGTRPAAGRSGPSGGCRCGTSGRPAVTRWRCSSTTKPQFCSSMFARRAYGWARAIRSGSRVLMACQYVESSSVVPGSTGRRCGSSWPSTRRS